MILNQDQVLQFYKMCDAAWVHNGDLSAPHGILSTPDPVSGEDRHTNGYFNSPKVLGYTNICMILAWQLIQKLMIRGVKVHTIDYVVGSSYSAVTLSFAVAYYLNAVHVFAQKDPSDPNGKKMIFKDDLEGGSTLLHIEELMTMAGTLYKVHDAVLKKNPDKGLIFLPVVGTLVHRPEKLPVKYSLSGTPIQTVSLIEQEVWAIKQSKCDLCKAGSEALSPKIHWDKLTGKA